MNPKQAGLAVALALGLAGTARVVLVRDDEGTLRPAERGVSSAPGLGTPAIERAGIRVDRAPAATVPPVSAAPPGTATSVATTDSVPETTVAASVGTAAIGHEDGAAGLRGRLARLEARAEDVFVRQTGDDGLALLRELAELGPDCWPLAGKLVLRLQRAIDDDNWLGVDVHAFHRAARSGSLPEMYLAKLEEPRADPELRRLAARELPWTDRDDVTARFLMRLAQEEDPSVARRIAATLVDRPSAANLPALLEALRAQRDPGARGAIVEAISAVPGQAAARALADLAATEPDRDLRRAVEALAQGRATSVAGYLVTDVVPGSQAAAVGIRPGDVVTTYQGVALTSYADLDRARAGVKSEDRVLLSVHRSGSLLSFAITGPRMGVNGRLVRPAGRDGPGL